MRHRVVPVLIITPLPKETDQLLRVYTNDKQYQNPNKLSSQQQQQQQHPHNHSYTAQHHQCLPLNHLQSSPSSMPSMTFPSSASPAAHTNNNNNNSVIAASATNTAVTNNSIICDTAISVSASSDTVASPSLISKKKNGASIGTAATKSPRLNLSTSFPAIATTTTATATTTASSVRNLSQNKRIPKSPTGNTVNSVTSSSNLNANDAANPFIKKEASQESRLYYYKKKNSLVSEWFIEDKCHNGQERVLFRVTHTGARHAPSLRQALYKQAIENDSVIVFLFSYTKQVNLPDNIPCEMNMGYLPSSLFKTTEIYMREFAELYNQLKEQDNRALYNSSSNVASLPATSSPNFRQQSNNSSSIQDSPKLVVYASPPHHRPSQIVSTAVVPPPPPSFNNPALPLPSKNGSPRTPPVPANNNNKSSNNNNLYQKQANWLDHYTSFFSSGCYLMASHVDLHLVTKNSVSEQRKYLFTHGRYSQIFDDKCFVEFDLSLGINVAELFQRIFKAHIDAQSMKLMLKHQALLDQNLKKRESVKSINTSSAILPDVESTNSTTLDPQDSDQVDKGTESKILSSKRETTIKKRDTAPAYFSTQMKEHKLSHDFHLEILHRSGDSPNQQKLIDYLYHQNHKTKLQLNKIFPSKLFGLKKNKQKDSSSKSDIHGRSQKQGDANINIQVILVPIPDKFIMKEKNKKVYHSDDESSSLKGNDERNTMSDTFFHDRVHFPLPFPYYHQHRQKANIKGAKIGPDDLHTVYNQSGITKKRQKQPIIVAAHGSRSSHKKENVKSIEGKYGNTKDNRGSNNTTTAKQEDTKIAVESEILENESFWADDPTENDLYGETSVTSCLSEEDASDDELSDTKTVSAGNSINRDKQIQAKRAHLTSLNNGDYSIMESNPCSSDLFDPDSLIENDEFTFKSDLMTDLDVGTPTAQSDHTSMRSSDFGDISNMQQYARRREQHSPLASTSAMRVIELHNNSYREQSSATNDNLSLDIVSS
jgi:hypothetical protein